jgi:uncharacterized OsmC-like protein
LEIEVSQRGALRQHSGKTPYSHIFYVIAFQIDESQRWALCHDSGKPPCPVSSDMIAAEI